MSPVVLTGPPGVGKTTVGALLAARLGREFVDLDAWIERAEGASVAELFARGGEVAFREAEARALRGLLTRGHETVIAVGGGALRADALREETLGAAVVVCLAATTATLLTRLGDASERPLFAGRDRREALEGILADRAASYAESHLVVTTDARSPEEVAEGVARRLREHHVLVRLGARSYRAHVGAGLADTVMRSVDEWHQRLWVYDEAWARAHVEHPLMARVGREASVGVSGSEKSLENVERVWRAAMDAGLDRNGVIVAIGGGSIGDVAGFAAATWKRGCAWINVPTTTLAMVDSSIGGKVGVDFGGVKNPIGAFHHPEEVFVDVRWLRALPEEIRRQGLVEALKCAALEGAAALDVFDAALDRALVGDDDEDAWSQIAFAALLSKARLVAADELDRGARRALNFGHTVGHAIELCAGLPHGVAVAHGMLAELTLVDGPDGRGLRQRLVRTLRRIVDLNRPTIDENAFGAALKHDKKALGEVYALLLPRGDGETVEVRASQGEVVRAFFAPT